MEKVFDSVRARYHYSFLTLIFCFLEGQNSFLWDLTEIEVGFRFLARLFVEILLNTEKIIINTQKAMKGKSTYLQGFI